MRKWEGPVLIGRIGPAYRNCGLRGLDGDAGHMPACPGSESVLVPNRLGALPPRPRSGAERFIQE